MGEKALSKVCFTPLLSSLYSDLMFCFRWTRYWNQLKLRHTRRLMHIYFSLVELRERKKKEKRKVTITPKAHKLSENDVSIYLIRKLWIHIELRVGEHESTQSTLRMEHTTTHSSWEHKLAIYHRTSIVFTAILFWIFNLNTLGCGAGNAFKMLSSS